MRLLFTLLFCGMFSCALGQSKIVSYTVPIDIHNEFMQINRGARDVEWVMHDYVYEVQFTQHGEQKSFIYNQAGQVIEKRFMQPSVTLPQAVGSSIKDHFPAFHIKQVFKREAQQKMTYLVRLGKASETMDLILDLNGNLISKTSNWTNSLK